MLFASAKIVAGKWQGNNAMVVDPNWRKGQVRVQITDGPEKGHSKVLKYNLIELKPGQRRRKGRRRGRRS